MATFRSNPAMCSRCGFPAEPAWGAPAIGTNLRSVDRTICPHDQE